MLRVGGFYGTFTLQSERVVHRTLIVLSSSLSLPGPQVDVGTIVVFPFSVKLFVIQFSVYNGQDL